MRFFTTSVFLVLAVISASAQTTTTVNQGLLTVINNHVSAVVAFHLEDSEHRGINQTDLIPVGSQHTYQASGDYKLDGVLYEDGSIQGPNRWRVDLHYKLWQEVQSGGPAYPSALDYTQRGDSYFYARIWARQYKRKHGVMLVIVWPGDPKPDTAPLSTINPNSMRAIGFQDGVLACLTAGPTAECDLGEVFDGTTGLDQATVTSSMTGRCTLPETILGKSDANVSGIAFTQCPMAVVQTDVYANTSAPYPYSGYLIALEDDWQVDYPSGLALTGYQLDSCSLPQYTSPPIIQSGCSLN